MEEETESKSRFLSEEEAGRLVAEEDKEQFVNDLYCLRAGLSVIAERAEEVRKRAEKIEVDRIEKKKKLLINNGYYCQDDGYAQEYSTDENFVTGRRRLLKKYRSVFITFMVLSVLCLVGACLAAYFYHINKVDGSKGILWRVLVCGFPALIGLVGVIFFAARAFDTRGDAKDVSLLVRRYENVSAGLKVIEREAAEERKKAEQLDAPLKTECSVIYAILAARFAKELDERDWKHLDLVIFYMETGRADNKKESLLLVEQQVQTDQITGAIEKATSRLETTINRAAGAICSRLNMVCSQLDRIAELQSKELRISATQLYVSLANNSNISSRDLMDMVSYVLS